MKFPVSLLTAALCALPAAHAAQTDCLDGKRYNLEIVCQTECAKEDAVAFSVSYDEGNDSCKCYKNVDGLGTYVGPSHSDDTHVTCYSMGKDVKTKIIGYGECLLDTNKNLGTTITMKVCDDENQVDCLDKKRFNKEGLCRKECAKINSAAFATSLAEESTIASGEADLCHCYSDKAVWSGSGDIYSSLTCFSMTGDKMKVLDYGGCVAEFPNGPLFTEHTMKRCQQEKPHVEQLLRGSVSN